MTEIGRSYKATANSMARRRPAQTLQLDEANLDLTGRQSGQTLLLKRM